MAAMVAAEAEALLVDEGRHAPEPESVAIAVEAVAAGAGADDLHEKAGERQRSLFSWAEFMAQESAEPKPHGRREAPTLSLLEWALDREREGALAGAAS